MSVTIDNNYITVVTWMVDGAQAANSMMSFVFNPSKDYYYKILGVNHMSGGWANVTTASITTRFVRYNNAEFRGSGYDSVIFSSDGRLLDRTPDRLVYGGSFYSDGIAYSSVETLRRGLIQRLPTSYYWNAVPEQVYSLKQNGWVYYHDPRMAATTQPLYMRQGDCYAVESVTTNTNNGAIAWYLERFAA